MKNFALLNIAGYQSEFLNYSQVPDAHGLFSIRDSLGNFSELHAEMEYANRLLGEEHFNFGFFGTIVDRTKELVHQHMSSLHALAETIVNTMDDDGYCSLEGMSIKEILTNTKILPT